MKERLPTLRWAAGGLLMIGIASRLLGVIREMLIANYFGVSSELDAVYLGLAVPMAITIGLGGGLARAVVPVAAPLDDASLAGLLRYGARRLALMMAALTVALAVSTPLWTPWLAGGSAAPTFELVVLCAAIACLGIVGGCLTGYLQGIANARGRHVSGGASFLTYNLVTIATLLIGWQWIGTLSVLLGIVLAEWSQLAMLWPVVRKLGSAAGGPRDREAERRHWSMVQVLIWPTGAAGALQGLNLAVDRAFATGLEPGAVAALAYADKLVNLPVGLLGMALATPLFTRLSRYHAQGHTDAFENTLNLGLRLLLMLGVPMGILLAAVGEPLIGLLLQRGAFSEDGVGLTSQAMLGYAAGIPFQAMLMLLLSAGLSTGRNWTLVGVMAVATMLNAGLNWALVGPLGLTGIALATSIVALVRMWVLLTVICPELLKHGETWKAAGTYCIYAFVLGAAHWAADGYLGMLGESVHGRVIRIKGHMAVTAIVTLVLWWPLLREEWRRLGALRRAVARDAEESR